jgi:hypothetical protein
MQCQYVRQKRVVINMSDKCYTCKWGKRAFGTDIIECTVYEDTEYCGLLEESIQEELEW